ncbi:MAG: Clp protease N-terminal domain-containing protein [Gemmatimonadales bacterium]
MVEARDVGHNYVGTEHVLLGVVREGESPAATVLLGQGLSAERLRSKILQLLGAPAPAAGTVQDLPLAADPGARLRSITVLVEDAGGQVSATRFTDIDSAIGHLTRLKRRA